MANEAIVVELVNGGGMRGYACASGTAITKGTLLVLSDPRTVAAHGTTAGVPFAGIAAMDKSATDYSTSISAYTNCIAELVSQGTIAVGAAVGLGNAANKISGAGVLGCTLASGAVVVGYALEAASTDEVINVRINV